MAERELEKICERLCAQLISDLEEALEVAAAIGTPSKSYIQGAEHLARVCEDGVALTKALRLIAARIDSASGAPGRGARTCDA